MATVATKSPPSTGAAAIGLAKREAEIHSNNTKPHVVSHGRGGAANIGVDDTTYADGGIIREGIEGDQGDGAFSTGRGGAANIGSPGTKPTKAADDIIIPETALRSNNHEVFHTGRGGEGNLHHETSKLDAPKTHHPKEEEKKAKEETPSVETSGSNKSKKRRSLFGRHDNVEDTDPEKKAKLEEKIAKKREHEEKFPPPTHGGLGDKLKYKLFGKLYD